MQSDSFPRSSSPIPLPASSPILFNSLSDFKPETDLKILLIYGYVRTHERIYNLCRDTMYNHIPNTVVIIIFSFFPQKYMVYAIGQDSHGYFGYGKEEQLTTFKKLPSWTFHCDSPKWIFTGMARFMIKTKFNNLYCAGRNEWGELGLGTDESKVRVYTQMKTNFLQKNDDIAIISNGKEAYHSLIISKKNRCYAFGKNDYGQLGNGIRSNDFTNSPQMISVKNSIFQTNNIVQIECGESHTLFLTHEGQLYSCGNNRYGQCGVNNKSNDDFNKDECILVPRKVHFMEDVIIRNMKCGSFHNVCVSDENKVWVFGSNELGQLGMFNRKLITVAEKQVYLNRLEVTHIDCGAHHTVCIAKNSLNDHNNDNDDNQNDGVSNDYNPFEDRNDCYIFGDNECGQIGVDYLKVPSVRKPLLFQSMNKNEFSDVSIYSASAGYLHTVLLTLNDELISFGSNHNYQCSNQKFDNGIQLPTLLDRESVGLDEDLEIDSIIAGYSSTIIICHGNYD